MDPPGGRIDLFHQGVRIGAFQLRQLPPVQHPGRQVMTVVDQHLQHIGAGAVGPGLALLAAGQAQFVEQHLAQLLRRADVELVASQSVNFFLQVAEPLAEIIR